jgi:hypothetical protein
MLWLALVSMLSAECQGQNDYLPSEDYFEKSRNRRIAAWSMIGLGIVTTVTGMVLEISDPDYPLFGGPQQGKIEYEWVTSAGPTIILGSIPFFISARKYRDLAISISFNKHRNLVPGVYLTQVNKQTFFSAKVSF